MNHIKRRWRKWRLKYTTILLVSLVVFFMVVRIPAVNDAIRQLSQYGYVGAAVAGMFFVSAYTAVPAAYVLFELGHYLNPVEIALIGGLGSMVGDYLIFRFVKDQLYDELKPHFRWFNWFRQRRKHRLLRALMPIVGIIIIISPFPDEVGIGLLGITKMNGPKFLLLSYVLGVAGIYLLAVAARLT